MSSWEKKLEKKLATLTDIASKETIQTVANWVAFNRKHYAIFASTLTKSLLQDTQDNPKRQWLYWQLIHEILIAERDTPTKWEKLIDLRVALGEGLIPTMEQLGKSMLTSTELSDYLKDWENLNVFDGPLLMSQIKRLYQSRDSSSAGTGSGATAATDIPAQPIAVTAIASQTDEALPSSTVDANSKEESPNQGPEDVKPRTDETPSKESSKKSPAKRRSSYSQNNNITMEYDFEAKGVQQGKVEAKEFLEPCKAIATLQIARDVRANTALEVSTGIANLPEDIVQACKDLQSGEITELDAAKINDYSVRIPSNLLDLNIEDELGSVHTYQDIVQRQKKAREQLILLLLKSRCQFGSQDAAKDYYATEGISKKLKKRKQLLSDALELEGLDTSEIVDDNKKETLKEQDLTSISWYNPNPQEDTLESETKKQCTE